MVKMVEFRFEVRAIRDGAYYIWDTQINICEPLTFGNAQQLVNLGLLNPLQLTDETLVNLLKQAPVPIECGGVGDPIIPPPVVVDPIKPPNGGATQVPDNDDVSVSWVPTGKDEIEIQITVRNKTQSTREYRAFVYNSSGLLLDKEPDFSWKNVKSGSIESWLVKSSFDASWDINNVFPVFRVSVHEQNSGEVGNIIVNLQEGSSIESPEQEITTPLQAPPIQDSLIPLPGGGLPIIPPEEDGLSFGLGLGTGGIGIAAIALIALFAFSKK